MLRFRKGIGDVLESNGCFGNLPCEMLQLAQNLVTVVGVEIT